MATLEELQAELSAVNAAVNAAYGSAEYEVQDGATRRKLRRQDLSVLLARKSALEMSISRLDGGGVGYGMAVDSHSPLNR
jgi:hypothetical protein